MILAWIPRIVKLFPQVPFRVSLLSGGKTPIIQVLKLPERKQSFLFWQDFKLLEIWNTQCGSLLSGTLDPQNWSLIDDWLLALKFANRTCTDSLLLLQKSELYLYSIDCFLWSSLQSSSITQIFKMISCLGQVVDCRNVATLRGNEQLLCNKELYLFKLLLLEYWILHPLI